MSPNDLCHARLLLSATLAAMAGCAYPGYRGPAPASELDDGLAGCYEVRLAGWTDAHRRRFGFSPPGQVELHAREATSRDLTETDVEGFDPNTGGAAGRLLLPTTRDMDSRWGSRSDEAGADSVFLAWYGLHAGIEVGLPASDGASGRLRFVPERYTRDLGAVTLRLTRSGCAQSSS
jgi:hypothetical protein